MLRIQRFDVGARRTILVLQGHIVAESAEALERECHEVTRTGLRIDLDLSGVAFIGRSGFEALGRLARGGARIVACSPLVAEMLEQEGIEAGRDADDDRDPQDAEEGGDRGGGDKPRGD